MPDAAGNIKGIALGGKAGEAWERIFGRDEYGRRPSDPVRTHPLPDGRVALCGGSAIRPHRCKYCED